MPKRDVSVRTEDTAKFDSITDKAEWIHQALKATDVENGTIKQVQPEGDPTYNEPTYEPID